MANAMKHMASSFAKLEKFEGVDSRRWQKRMHFMLSSMSVVYVLMTPMPNDGGLILNGMSDSLFDVQQNVDTSKELWDTLEAKYMAEDASSKKFLVSNFTNYKMTDSRPVLEQYNELLGILGRFTQHKMNMGKSIKVSCIIDKLPPSWKDFKYTLKHLKEELTLIKLGSHLHIKESPRAQDNDKSKGNNVAGPSDVNMVEHNSSSRNNDKKGKRKHHDTRANPNKKLKSQWIKHKRIRGWFFQPFERIMMLCSGLTLEKLCMCAKIDAAFMSTSKQKDSILWPARLGHVHFKRMQDMSKDGLILAINMDTEKFWGCKAAVRLPDPKLKSLGERGIECIFVGYVKHSKAFKFYVIEPNDSVAINSIIESRDAIFVEQRFSSILRPSQRHRTPKDFGPEFQLYLIEETRDEVFDQHSYCINVENDPKTFNEAMKSQNVAFWKEAINDEMDSIMGNNTWVVDYFDTYALVARISTIRLLIAMASIHSLIIHQMDVKTTFLNKELEEEVYMNQPLGFIMPGNKNKVDLTKEFLSSRFSIKDMGEAYVILVSTPLDTCEKLMSNRGLVVSQLEYSRVIGCLMYAMACTRPDIAFAMGKLSRYTSNPGTQHLQAIQRVLKYLKKTMDYRLVYSGYPSVLEGYTDASWISNTKDNSSTNGWVFLLGGGLISWASKKQTCITGSKMESEFMALAAASKEAEWLKNLLLEIPLWVKPMAPISIHCDSAATLAKAYIQMYNGKSRHLGVRHSMIRELITNGMVSLEFARSQQNLTDHLTKGLARDLVIKSAKGMRLNSN
nr:zinc finger, CCHC-type [Tanacetum cinerariifolium]